MHQCTHTGALLRCGDFLDGTSAHSIRVGRDAHCARTRFTRRPMTSSAAGTISHAQLLCNTKQRVGARRQASEGSL
eukprot:2084534-Prymnesium_polylepis.2